GALMLASGCTGGPNDVRPTAEVPPAYRELDGWKVAQPGDQTLRGSWWERFGDPRLNALESQVDVSSQTVAAAEAQLRQARALVQAARAAYYPTITVGLGITRTRESLNTSGASTPPRRTVTRFQLPLEISWEPDLWGRVRRSVESSQAGAQASLADLESARLSVRAELAQDYFALGAVDAERALLDATIAAFEKSLDLTRN